ncbi:hypothetical protein KL86PLE_90083 [uncultured Pleomorphomonas sp.]|uniref:Uncharacterized protein n=1 Tax=uncultured Pleomorphomonas sp. TaxID=442121 RepID=A0A212LMP1_9HYPH|nr:hypothetical protein KL86PLE_90083 [uncultured Pleomorphomonas sp.]
MLRPRHLDARRYPESFDRRRLTPGGALVEDQATDGSSFEAKRVKAHRKRVPTENNKRTCLAA